MLSSIAGSADKITSADGERPIRLRPVRQENRVPRYGPFTPISQATGSFSWYIRASMGFAGTGVSETGISSISRGGDIVLSEAVTRLSAGTSCSVQGSSGVEERSLFLPSSEKPCYSLFSGMDGDEVGDVMCCSKVVRSV